MLQLVWSQSSLLSAYFLDFRLKCPLKQLISHRHTHIRGLEQLIATLAFNFFHIEVVASLPTVVKVFLRLSFVLTGESC